MQVQGFIKPAPELLPVAPYQPYLYVRRVPPEAPITVHVNYIYYIQATAPGPGSKSEASLTAGDDLPKIQAGILSGKSSMKFCMVQTEP